MLAVDLYNTLKDIDGGFFAIAAPQDRVLPYTTYQIISDIKTNALDGECDYPQTRFQIDIYGATLEKTIVIKSDIETKLKAATTFKTIIYQTFSGISDEGNVFNTVVDFKLTK